MKKAIFLASFLLATFLVVAQTQQTIPQPVVYSTAYLQKCGNIKIVNRAITSYGQRMGGPDATTQSLHRPTQSSVGNQHPDNNPGTKNSTDPYMSASTNTPH